MDIPKAQEKLNIKRFSNKKRTKGQNQYFYEVRTYDNTYIGDIDFLDYNNRWYLQCRTGLFLSMNEIEEISNFMIKLPINKRPSYYNEG